MRGVGLVLCGVLALACADAEPASEPETVLPEASESVAAPAEAAPVLPGISVALTEWSVTLSQDTASAGPVSFNVTNTGTVHHAFEVEGNGEEWATDPIAPGASLTMSLNLTPGEYRVYCPVESAGGDHESRGMVTRLRVN